MYFSTLVSLVRRLIHPSVTDQVFLARLHFKEVIIGIVNSDFFSWLEGARFGPRAIRAGSARQTTFRGFNFRAGVNPYTSWAKVVDCGDIPITPFDNKLALRQMSEAYLELGSRSTLSGGQPKLITLGGDHSVALPALRALKEIYGQPVAVLHFDAHLDTWHPAKYPSIWIDEKDPTTQSFFNHGSMFWIAGTEGLIANRSSVHAGLRTRLAGNDDADLEDDSVQGWYRIMSDDIDDIGVRGVIDTIMAKIGTEIPVYLSLDIDVVDPGLAPATGTPEPGGWTTREMIRILRGIESLNIVGADIVEVSPGYDNTGEVTSLAAAQFVYEILSSMVKNYSTVNQETHNKDKDEL